MLLTFCVVGLILYLVFIVDWEAFRPAFAKGAWVALALNVVIALGYYAAKVNHVIAVAGASGHH